MSLIVKLLKKADTTARSGRLRSPDVTRRIAEKAYALWEQRGRPHGSDLQDWIEAERIVRGKPSRESRRSILRDVVFGKSSPGDRADETGACRADPCHSGKTP